MKLLLTTLLAASVILMPACQPSLEKEINELHAASVKLGDEFAPKLEELVQRSNGINIQGRALTPEEMEFTGAVATLQDVFATWKEDMETVAGKAPDQARLEEEKALNEAIVNLANTATLLE